MGSWTNGTNGGPDAHGGGWSMDIDVSGTNGGPDAHGGGAGWASSPGSPGWSMDMDVRHRDPGPWVGLFGLEPGLSVRLRLLGHAIGCPSGSGGRRQLAEPEDSY